MKNIFLRRLIKTAKKFVRKHKKTNQILIVSTTALGDTLWATPAIKSIRDNFPHCYMAVLTSPIGMEVLRNNPNIDRLFLLKEPLSKSFFTLRKQLYKEKFDTVLIFHASQRLTLPLCSLIGANKIIGTAGINKGLDTLLTHPMPNCAQHEIVRRLKIAEAIGVKPTTQKLSYFLKDELAPRSPGPWIAFHPGSKDSFKRWPSSKFIELGQRLKNERSCEILITGTETALMTQIASNIPGAHIDKPRPLGEFAALLNQMDLVVANDTGPFHLACALNKPVIGIYASTDPALCGPHKAEKAVIVSRRISCDPCLKRKCRQPFCFLQIGVDEVYSKIQDVLFS